MGKLAQRNCDWFNNFILNRARIQILMSLTSPYIGSYSYYYSSFKIKLHINIASHKHTVLRTSSCLHRCLPQCFHSGNRLTWEADKPGFRSPLGSMWLWTSNHLSTPLLMYLENENNKICLKGLLWGLNENTGKVLNMKINTLSTSSEWQLSWLLW